MWFVYVEGHGITEFDDSEQKEMTECVRDYLQTHQSEAITVIEGKDITGQVQTEIEIGVYEW